MREIADRQMAEAELPVTFVKNMQSGKQGAICFWNNAECAKPFPAAIEKE
ncbi:MAG: hypothetical protein IJG17_03655 [Eubacterium sp.]|nr:hypothetical protein [Eubacterium sp.]